jgi:CLIP-associating protein 1/2
LTYAGFQALNNRDWLIIRESAAAAIIAAQLVLQDATHLFTLLDGLADEKKNLLTYLFERHTVRGTTGTAGLGSTVNSRTERLEKEMNRLDTKTSTPSRIMAAS